MQSMGSNQKDYFTFPLVNINSALNIHEDKLQYTLEHKVFVCATILLITWLLQLIKTLEKPAIYVGVLNLKFVFKKRTFVYI